jgi:hypothetical protein
MSKAIKSTDHLGNEFESKLKMYEYWNIPYNTAYARENLGWSLEKTLTTPIGGDVATDHLGNIFNSDKEMYEYWNIPEYIARSRKSKGWSIERILTTSVPNKDKYIEDHLGNKFNSDKEMYEYWDIPYNVGNARKNLGWSIDKILTQSLRLHKILDPISNKYITYREIEELYNINSRHINRYLKKGYTIPQIFGISIKIRSRYYNINKTKYNLTVSKRIKKGKDVFECYINNPDGTQTFKIMSYDMIDQYCIEQYKRLNNIE